MTIRLSNAELNLLKDVISRCNPSLLNIVESLGIVPITIDQREELREMIATELIQTGLRENDEPNERGLLLERLIDRLGHV